MIFQEGTNFFKEVLIKLQRDSLNNCFPLRCMDKLILFDIDRTLIKEMKICRSHWTDAFKEVYGVEVTAGDLNSYFPTTHGFTFKRLVRKFLRDNGIEEKIIWKNFKRFTKILVKLYLKNLKKAEIVAVDGAEELLKELKKRKVFLGLVTGNAEEIARGKLKKAGLGRYFSFGGFGETDIDRVKLVRIAIRGGKREGFTEGKIFVVGDTPLDVKSGKEANVKTIGVASGIYSCDELKKAGADFILDGLWQKEKFLEIVFG